jgi:hypothetical protein
MNENLVITWTDSGPAEHGLAEPARDRGGQLLAAGPVHDAGEPGSRPAPAGVVIARFSAEEAARSWFDAVAGKLDGTILLAAGATAPVWWPPESEPERPQWSRRGELPAGQVRPIRKIQMSSGPRRPPVPSSPAHPRATGPARRRRCTRPQSGSVS